VQIELGLDTFGDLTPDATHAEVIRNVVEKAVLADDWMRHSIELYGREVIPRELGG
jgi:hypothetical protein